MLPENNNNNFPNFFAIPTDHFRDWTSPLAPGAHKYVAVTPVVLVSTKVK